MNGHALVAELTSFAWPSWDVLQFKHGFIVGKVKMGKTICTQFEIDDLAECG